MGLLRLGLQKQQFKIMQVPKSQLLDYGPQLPELSGKAMAAKGQATEAIGGVVSNVGDTLFALNKRVRQAEEAGKTAKYFMDRESRVNKFVEGLAMRSDYENWDGEVDAILNDSSGAPDLSNEGAYALKMKDAEFVSGSKNKILHYSMTKRLEDAKASVAAAAQAKFDAGDHVGSAAEYDKAPWLTLKEKQVIQQKITSEGRDGAAEEMFTAEDLTKSSSQLVKEGKAGTIGGADRARRSFEIKQERAKADAARDVREKVEEVEHNQKAGVYDTPERYEEALKATGVGDSERKHRVKAFRDNTPLPAGLQMESDRLVSDFQGRMYDLSKEPMTEDEFYAEREAGLKDLHDNRSREGGDRAYRELSGMSYRDSMAVRQALQDKNISKIRGSVTQLGGFIGAGLSKQFDKDDEALAGMEPKSRGVWAYNHAAAKAEAMQAAAQWAQSNPTADSSAIMQHASFVYASRMDARHVPSVSKPAPTNKMQPVIVGPEGFLEKTVSKIGGSMSTVIGNATGKNSTEPMGGILTAEPTTTTVGGDRQANMSVEPGLPNFEPSEAQAGEGGVLPPRYGNAGDQAEPNVVVPPLDEGRMDSPETRSYSKPATNTTVGVIPQYMPDGLQNKMDGVFVLKDGGWVGSSLSSVDTDPGDKVDSPAIKGKVTIGGDAIYNPSAPTFANASSFIASIEGFAPVAKWDYGQYSVGYGTKAKYPGEKITKEEALVRLEEEISGAQKAVVSGARKYGHKLTDAQVVALTSFAYNLGSGKLDQVFSAGDTPLEWALAIKQFRRAGGKVLRGLERRRISEAAMMGVTISYT